MDHHARLGTDRRPVLEVDVRRRWCRGASPYSYRLGMRRHQRHVVAIAAAMQLLALGRALRGMILRNGRRLVLGMLLLSIALLSCDCQYSYRLESGMLIRGC